MVKNDKKFGPKNWSFWRIFGVLESFWSGLECFWRGVEIEKILKCVSPETPRRAMENEWFCLKGGGGGGKLPYTLTTAIIYKISYVSTFNVVVLQCITFTYRYFIFVYLSTKCQLSHSLKLHVGISAIFRPDAILCQMYPLQRRHDLLHGNIPLVIVMTDLYKCAFCHTSIVPVQLKNTPCGCIFTYTYTYVVRTVIQSSFSYR